MIRRALMTLACCLAAGAAAPAAAVALPAGFEEITLASGLTQPTAVAFAPASDGRMFIAEQAGRVKVRASDGTITVLLDWRDRVNSFGDRGLIGIATDRDFAANGYLYVSFVADDDDVDDPGPHSSRLVRLTVSPANEVVASKSIAGGDADQGTCPTPDGLHTTDADAKRDCIPATTPYHAVGTVVSDPRDGTIWWGTGDAESVSFTDANRPNRLHTYNEESYAGKVMHVDRDGRGLPGHAFCPGVTDLDRICTKIHAMGFRNPFRFTVPAQPGKPPIVADVGDLRREELNLATAGGNYGWPCWEGSNVRPRNYSTYAGCGPYVSNPPFGAGASGGTPRNVIAPTFEYDHDGADAAVLAGPVYEDDDYPAEYRGSLFFGDYARGFIRRFPAGPTPGTFSITPASILNFGQANSSVLFASRAAFTQLTTAPNGDLVVVDFVTPGPSFDFTGPGRVVRIGYAPANRAPVARARIVGGEEVASGSEVRFDGTSSSDPDGDPLTYAWDFDGDGATDSTEAEPVWTFAQSGVKTVALVVGDGRGRTDRVTIQVLVDRHRPQVTIETPSPGELYDGGRTIALRGDATDADEPAGLGDARLRWEIRLLHGEHFHPLVDIVGRTGAFTAWQDHGLDSSYRIRLIATDADGLEGSATVDIAPRPATVGVRSDPPGAPIEVDDEQRTAPVDVPSAVGMLSRLRAAADFTRDGRLHRFVRWEDGSTARERSYEVPRGGGTLTAVYAAAPAEVDPRTERTPSVPPPAPAFAPRGGPAPPTRGSAAPVLRMTSPWPGRRRTARMVTGTLTGVDARPAIGVAVGQRAGSRCRWWNARDRRFGRAGSCAAPVWTAARVTRTSAGWRFDAALRAAVARRPGTVRARAVVGGRTVAQVAVRVAAAR